MDTFASFRKAKRCDSGADERPFAVQGELDLVVGLVGREFDGRNEFFPSGGVLLSGALERRQREAVLEHYSNDCFLNERRVTGALMRSRKPSTLQRNRTPSMHSITVTNINWR